MKTILCALCLVVGLAVSLPSSAAVLPAENLYWLLPWDLTADNEAPLTDLLGKQSQDFAFECFTVQVAPPTCGFDLDQGLAIANRVEAKFPGKLVLATPVVGTEGWETSCRPPRGLRAAAYTYTPEKAQTQAQWLKSLEAWQGDKVALIVGRLAEPDPDVAKVAAYVKTFAQWARDHGKTPFVWMPALALTRPGGEDLLKAVAGGAGELVESWVWVDAPGMIYGAKAMDLPALLKQITAITPADKTVLEFNENARGISTPQVAEEFIAGAQAAGVNRFAVLGTPQDMVAEGWQAFYKGLSVVLMPPPCGTPVGHG